jgi:hypothetical protein
VADVTVTRGIPFTYREVTRLSVVAGHETTWPSRLTWPSGRARASEASPWRDTGGTSERRDRGPDHPWSRRAPGKANGARQGPNTHLEQLSPVWPTGVNPWRQVFTFKAVLCGLAVTKRPWVAHPAGDRATGPRAPVSSGAGRPPITRLTGISLDAITPGPHPVHHRFKRRRAALARKGGGLKAVRLGPSEERAANAALSGAGISRVRCGEAVTFRHECLNGGPRGGLIRLRVPGSTPGLLLLVQSGSLACSRSPAASTARALAGL